MANNRSPRGGKPAGGKPAGGKPAGGRPARSGGASAGRSAREGGPSAGRGRAGAGGERSRFSPGREGGPGAGAGKPRTGGKPAPKRDLTGKPVGGRPGRPERPGRSERPTSERRPTAERRPRVEPRELETFEAAPESEAGNDILFGRHAVVAALEGSQTINKVWILNGLKNHELVSKVRQLAKEKGASVQMVERVKLDNLTNEGNHQGLVASVAAATYVDLETVIEKALQSDYPAILMLDGIEDPHNLGALIRSAEAAGFAGVVIPNRRAVGVTPVAAKSSAGATARVPIARVGNLAQAAETVKKAGFWLIGAEGEAEKTVYEVDMTQPLCLVIGSEGKGLGRLMGDKCDHRVKLPMQGEMESLNASVAGGIMMYEAVRQRLAKKK